MHGYKEQLYRSWEALYYQISLVFLQVSLSLSPWLPLPLPLSCFARLLHLISQNPLLHLLHTRRNSQDACLYPDAARHSHTFCIRCTTAARVHQHHRPTYTLRHATVSKLPSHRRLRPIGCPQHSVHALRQQDGHDSYPSKQDHVSRQYHNKGHTGQRQLRRGDPPDEHLC